MKAILVGFVIAMVISLPNAAKAIEADRYVKWVPGGGVISFDRDHFSVSLLKSQVVANDNFIKGMFSSKARLLLNIDRGVTFFDGDRTTLSTLHDNTDLHKKTRRSCGNNIVLIDNVPADAAVSTTIKLATYREDNLAKVFETLKDDTSGLSDVIGGQYIAYAKVVGDIIRKVFGTDKKEYPFYWSGDYKLGDVYAPAGIAPTGMKEHYLLLISKQKDGQDGLIPSKLEFDETNSVLKYEGKEITEYSYFVLKVAKSNGYDIKQLLLESSAPWAILAKNAFLSPPIEDSTNLDQLRGTSKNLMAQLRNEIELLNKEHRFSKYDRAVALKFFTDSSIQAINSRCAAVTIPEANCPTSALSTFGTQIASIYNLKLLKDDITSVATALSNATEVKELKSELKQKSDLLKNVDKMDDVAKETFLSELSAYTSEKEPAAKLEKLEHLKNLKQRFLDRETTSLN